jgi:hypothetical protein
MKIKSSALIILTVAMLITACGGPSQNPEEVYKAYHAAIESGDLDGAMAYIAEDASYKVPVGTLIGKEEIRSFNEEAIDQGATATCENYVVNGDVLTCDFKIDFGAFEVAGDLVVTIIDGLITDYDFTMTG